MRIGIDCRLYSTEFGIGRYVDELIKNLAKIDTKNEYILYFKNPEFENFKCPTPNFKKYLVNAPIYSLKEQTIFPLAIKQTKPDLIHFTHFNTPLLTLRKQIVTIHDLTLHYYPGKKYTSLIKRLAYKIIFKASILKAKKIITVSKNTENDLHELYRFTKKKTQNIYLGLAESFKTNHSSSIKLPEKYLLYTGNWRSHKNLINLVRAFNILKSDYSYQGKLVITGKEDPHYPETRNKIQELGLENEVITTGLVSESDLAKIYENADCYIYPSLYEGFGLPILEAFSTKTPVACSNKACLPEIGSNGVTTFSPIDPQDIALKVNKILTDEEYRSQLIENGQQRLKDFSFEKMAKETLELYNNA
jgi:glycosyltransferase involved in cell wall biosynthesis